MRLVKVLILLSLFSIAGFYFLEQNDISPEEAMDRVTNVVQEKKNMLETKIAPEEVTVDIPLEGALYNWIGKSSDELVQVLGEPHRKDLSAYGYTWWVYTDQSNQYIQFGVDEEEIKTIYATGSDLEIEPVIVGQSYASVEESFPFLNEITYSKGVSSYTFHVNVNDIQMRPLVKLTDDIFIQFYFDTFTSKLSSIRILTAETLLEHRPYEVKYRGSLPGEPDLSDEGWAEVEQGMEQQIYDITNVIRKQHEKTKLEWEDSVSDVAFKHSKDMADNNYFSHYSPDGSGLKERLEAGNVSHAGAGENIAAQYPDAAAAVEGWLNSEGHREALLSDDFTHLGVGVYRLYYTQNFLAKPF
ncbi:CAP domain-containing protein [Virgibacillus sp. C22-A2]|uniref:CAP domain-containing protein n=1 Tax=Virgibacillus tibetensis TaxID=3042313 RepID=A0ABU6KCB1_9BACI|nr:CAP domain-containing protein [Virgibacillus sp. C22-A2]